MAAKTTLTDAQDKFIELTAKTGAQMTTRMTRSLIRLGFLDNGNELTDLGREYAIAQGWIVVEPPAPTEAPHAAPVDSADSEPVSAYVGDTIETDNGTRGVVAELYSVFDQDMVRFTRSDNGESMGLPDYHIVKVIDAEAKPFAIGDTVIFDNAGEPTIAQVMRVVGSGGYEVAYNKTPGSFLAFAEAHELAHAAQPTSAAGGDAVKEFDWVHITDDAKEKRLRGEQGFAVDVKEDTVVVNLGTGWKLRELPKSHVIVVRADSTPSASRDTSLTPTQAVDVETFGTILYCCPDCQSHNINLWDYDGVMPTKATCRDCACSARIAEFERKHTTNDEAAHASTPSAADFAADNVEALMSQHMAQQIASVPEDALYTINAQNARIAALEAELATARAALKSVGDALPNVGALESLVVEITAYGGDAPLYKWERFTKLITILADVMIKAKEIVTESEDTTAN